MKKLEFITKQILAISYAIALGRVNFSDLIAKIDINHLVNFFRIFLWYGRPLNWDALPTAGRSARNTIPIAECRFTAADHARIFSVHGPSSAVGQIMLLSPIAIGAGNQPAIDFRSRAAGVVNVDLSSRQGQREIDICARLVSLSKSTNPTDNYIYKNLIIGDFTSSYNASDDDNKKTVEGLAACSCFHNIQKASKFIDCFNNARVISLRSWLLSNSSSEKKKTLNTVRSNGVFNNVNNYSRATRNVLRKATRIKDGGKAGVATNGALPGPVIRLEAEVNSLTASTAAPAGRMMSNSEASAHMQPGADRVIDSALELTNRFGHVRSIRNEAVLAVAKEAGLSALNPDDVSQFRSYAAGLTERAFIMAFVAEAVRVGQALTGSASNYKSTILDCIGRSRSGTGMNGQHSLLQVAGFIPQVYRCNNLKDLIEDQIEALSIEAKTLRNVNKGKWSEDVKIAQAYLNYIYNYAGWSNNIYPEKDAASYREHRWRTIYINFGLFGHVFP
jgi:hypothetical protein